MFGGFGGGCATGCAYLLYLVQTCKIQVSYLGKYLGTYRCCRDISFSTGLSEVVLVTDCWWLDIVALAEYGCLQFKPTVVKMCPSLEFFTFPRPLSRNGEGRERESSKLTVSS